MSPDELTTRLNQQELVANFGVFALMPGDLQRLLNEACLVAAQGLGTPFAKVLRYRPDSNDLLVEAGIGWHAGVVGTSTIGSGMNSPAGYAIHTGQPTLSNHLAHEQRFRLPGLLAEHGVQSAINVVIGNHEAAPFGALEVDSTRRHEFVQADIVFLQALANVLAAGLVRLESEQAKDALLQDKDLLMREVHHRVKNSLQLVRTMLTLQARGCSDETREQLEQAASRIMSIAAVHQRLYEGGSVAGGDAAVYLASLLDDMRGMLDEYVDGRTIRLTAESLVLPADALTPLGLIVSELVTNALKYGVGQVTVQVGRTENGLRITVEDEGSGFPPEPGRGLGMRLIAALAKGNSRDAISVDRSVAHSKVVVNVTF